MAFRDNRRGTAYIHIYAYLVVSIWLNRQCEIPFSSTCNLSAVFIHTGERGNEICCGNHHMF